MVLLLLVILEGARASTGLCVDVSSGLMIIPYRPIRISRENNLIQIVLPGGRIPGGSTKLSMFVWAMFSV